MWYPDLGHETQLPRSGDDILAVGWLGKGHDFPCGEVRSEELARLKEFVRRRSESMLRLLGGVFAGVHTCEFCERCHGASNIAVLDGRRLWIAPEMITHYVEAHEYLPPASFLEALSICPLPDSDEYQELAASFLRNRVQDSHAAAD